jgi:hypothetical protein
MEVAPFNLRLRFEIILRRHFQYWNSSEESSVNMEVATIPASVDWRDGYQAALLEAERSRILQRIADAEIAIILRRRQLFCAGGEPAEWRELDAALDALRDLRCFTGAWRNDGKMLRSILTVLGLASIAK